MSWSLQLRHGDFALSSASYGTVTSKAKLVQDLRCHILERMGTDPSHPGYGSLLDGGVTPEGEVVNGVIGENRSRLVETQVQADLLRIVREHQAKQLARAKQDKLTTGRPTQVPGEILYSLDGIDVYQELDVLFVTLRIRTATGEESTLDFNFVI